MYNHKSIEQKWQKYWDKTGLFKTRNNKKKYYILDMFPYPSGSGLHVGHPEGYTATDIVTRYKMMKGYNVLHPMGWDSFGLPAENYAIKTKIHPKETTNNCIKKFKEQIKSIGFAYDWDREVATSDRDYYKWTQWFFLFLYKNGLAYRKEAPVNYCDNCKTTLANEQVIQGNCERCKNTVHQKNLTQWFFKITDFAEDLITGLDKLDWPNSTKISQKNWIGKSIGAEIDFQIENHKDILSIYTTRIDTIFSGTFIVMAPEHPLINKITTKEYIENVQKYQKTSSMKNEIERTDMNKDKTGVFTGAYAINPANGDRMPIWISDFVIASYGSGAVFADAHDERDFEMAKKYGIPLKVSLKAKNDDPELWEKIRKFEVCYTDDGILVNSNEFDGLTSSEARERITKHFEEKGCGRKKIQYKLRDWLVSRQRYWGAPIPIIYCPICGEVPVPEKDLPVTLPTDVDFLPTGESPLKDSKEFNQVKCPKCGNSEARREVDTMDTFVCSSWYFFRYTDPKNKEVFASEENIHQWLPVDMYVGGAEHTVLHLLYSRFFTKSLHRYKLIDFDEPFISLRHQGIILGEDNEKMSKSRGNVINPDDIINEYGADTLRLYEMFIGDFSQSKPWSMKGIEGCSKFLHRVWRLFDKSDNNGPSKDIEKLAHKSIKKVSHDIENFRFNTAISTLMIFTNALYKEKTVSKKSLETLTILLSPFAPHISEELWERLGYKESIINTKWPEYIEELAKDDNIEMVIQVNGKVRDKIIVPHNISKEEALNKAKNTEKIKKHCNNRDILKEIYVPGKIINIVIS